MAPSTVLTGTCCQPGIIQSPGDTTLHKRVRNLLHGTYTVGGDGYKHSEQMIYMLREKVIQAIEKIRLGVRKARSQYQNFSYRASENSGRMVQMWSHTLHSIITPLWPQMAAPPAQAHRALPGVGVGAPDRSPERLSPRELPRPHPPHSRPDWPLQSPHKLGAPSPQRYCVCVQMVLGGGGGAELQWGEPRPWQPRMPFWGLHFLCNGERIRRGGWSPRKCVHTCAGAHTSGRGWHWIL